MAKQITKGGKHYGTADDVVARIEELEAALQAADELAKVAHEVSVDAYGVEYTYETTFHRDVHEALHPTIAAYRKARGGET